MGKVKVKAKGKKQGGKVLRLHAGKLVMRPKIDKDGNKRRKEW